jgi:hypothetical protein
MKPLMRRIRCALFGHDWGNDHDEWPSGKSFCVRCMRYSDHPAVARVDKIRSFMRTWSPLRLLVSRYGVKVWIGLHRPVGLNVSFRLHWRWDRTGELPGVHVWSQLWRLGIGVLVGGGWQDEDGENRTLLNAYATFQTYGLRWIGCWFGHKPRVSSNMLGHVYCDRCGTSLELADADPRKAVAL